MFRRRDPRPLTARFLAALFPRRGYGRQVRYIRHRVSRIPDTPHRIALGFACGVMASFTPFFGCHFLISALLAWMLRANIIAGLIGTAVGNPLTFPFIAAISMNLGRRILGHGVTGRDFGRVIDALAEGAAGLWESLLSLVGLGESHWERLVPLLEDVVLPYTVGGILPGLVTSAAFYLLLRPLVAAYQARRRSRRARRACGGRGMTAGHPLPMVPAGTQGEDDGECDACR